MSKLVLLNAEQHKDLRVKTERSALLGDNIMFCQTFAQEFRHVQGQYPIFFQKLDGQDQLCAVALFGFTRGENLFLSEQGWDARYIPLMVQRQPFYIGNGKSQDGGSSSKVIHIDVDHPRVSQSDGVDLFDNNGQITDYLARVSGMLETIDQWSNFNIGFMAKLQEYQLLEPMNLDTTLKSGEKGQLLGFYAIHEERLQALSEAAIGELHRAGYLEPIYMALASISNVGELIERKSKPTNEQHLSGL